MPGRSRRSFGYIRKLPSGRYQATYLGPDMGRHAAPNTFVTKDAAVAWLRAEERLLDSALADGSAWSSPKDRATQARRQKERERFESYARRWAPNAATRVGSPSGPSP